MGEHRAVRALANRSAPVTRRSLVADLTALGVTAGDTVLVHTSLSALGWVCGGAVAVIQALLDAVGDDGTVVMPAFSTDLTDPEHWRNPPVPEPWWPVIRAESPAFDPDLTPTRAIGVVGETFRRWPGAVRGPHPHVSFAAYGPRAAEVVRPHDLAAELGEGSPLSRLHELDASVLLLGVDHGNNTALHLAEHRAELPDRRSDQQSATVLVDGHPQRRSWESVVLDDTDFAAVGEGIEARGVVRRGPVGAGEGRLMAIRDVVDLGAAELTRRRTGAEPSPAAAAIADISPLRDEERGRACAIFNHWIETSTATFHEEPLDVAAFSAEVVDHADPRHGCFGIRVDGDLVGFVVVAAFKGRCAYRDSAEVSVYLAPGAVGRGLGRQAIAYAVAHGRARGLHVLLAVVCTENAASLAAFGRAGYAEVGRLREVGRKFGRLLDVAYLEL
ncbi:MAG TPA: GNAT family N-acetyltransferase, partial [Frankiaceae bacterium]|nr:GNAT family N-acetyltransferase [Frankiaceae bacterium]